MSVQPGCGQDFLPLGSKGSRSSSSALSDSNYLCDPTSLGTSTSPANSTSTSPGVQGQDMARLSPPAVTLPISRTTKTPILNNSVPEEDVANLSSPESDHDEMYCFNNEMKFSLMRLLNSELARNDYEFRLRVQVRLMDAELELKRQRRRRVSVPTPAVVSSV